MDYLFRKYKVMIEILSITPDLSLRVFVAIVAVCSILISFFLGIMIGEANEAHRSIVFTGAWKHEPWTNETLTPAKGNIAAIGSVGERNYVASEGGKTYYPKNCKSASRIKEEHRIWFATAVLAEGSGYVKAKNCKWE